MLRRKILSSSVITFLLIPIVLSIFNVSPASAEGSSGIQSSAAYHIVVGSVNGETCQILAVNKSNAALSPFLVEGRWFVASDENVVILGTKLKEMLKVSVADYVGVAAMNGRECVVVGIFSEDAQNVVPGEYEAIIPMDILPYLTFMTGLTGAITDRGVDTDGDGLYNFLKVGAEVNITEAGTYIVKPGYVRDVYSNPISRGGTVAVILDAGVHNVNFSFTGASIRNLGTNPASISDFFLYDGYGHFLGSILDVNLSRTYLYTEFESPADLTRKVSDQGVDTDADGRYNYLMVTVEVNVTEPGVYLIAAAELLDASYNYLQPTVPAIYPYYWAWDRKEVYLAAGLHLVNLSFYGPDFHQWNNRRNPAFVTVTLHKDNTFIDGLYRVPLSTIYRYIDFDCQFNDMEVKFTVDPDRKVEVEGSLNMSDLTPRYQGPPMSGVVNVTKDGVSTLVSGEYSLVIPPDLYMPDPFSGQPVAPAWKIWPYNATTIDVYMEYLKHSPGIMNLTGSVTTVLPPHLGAGYIYPSPDFLLNSIDLALSGKYHDGAFYGSFGGTLWGNLSDVFKMIPLPVPIGFDAPFRINLDYSEGEYNGSLGFYLAPGLPIEVLTTDINGNLSCVCVSGAVTVPYGTYFGSTINKTVIDQIEYIFENVLNGPQDMQGSILNLTRGGLECPVVEIQREDLTIPLIGQWGERITFKICVRETEKQHGFFVAMLVDLIASRITLPTLPGAGEGIMRLLWSLPLNETLHKLQDINIDIEYTPDTRLDFSLSGKIPVEDILEQFSRPIPVPEIIKEYCKEYYPEIDLPDEFNATTVPEIWSFISPFVEGMKQCARSSLNSTIDFAYSHNDRTLRLNGGVLINTEMLIDGISRLPADVQYSVLAALNAPIPLITPGASETNTGTVGYMPSVDGNIVAFSTHETWVGTGPGQDLNGDGDTNDYVIQYYNMNTGTTTNTGAVGYKPIINGNIIVFYTPEGMAGTDLNGDGDTSDSVIQYYDVNSGTVTNTRKEGYLGSVSDGLIVFYTPEGMAGTDLNGDGDMNDYVIRIYEIASGTTVSTGIVGQYPWLSDGIIAFNTYEYWVWEDLNGDGDMNDRVIQYYNMTDQTVVNTRAIGFSPIVRGEIIAFSTVESDWGIDLNLDGDSGDYVVRYYNITDRTITNTGAAGFAYSMEDDIIVFYTYENMVGRSSLGTGWDLNYDRDRYDNVIRYYNVTSHRTINTGIVGTCPYVSNGIIVFSTHEAMVGKDLNGDGDTYDQVIQYFTVPELPRTEANWAQLSVTYADLKFDVETSLSVEGDINEAVNFIKDAFILNAIQKPWTTEPWILYETTLDLSGFKLGIEINQTYAGGHINSLVLSPPTATLNATTFKIGSFLNFLRFEPGPPYMNQRIQVTVQGGSNGTHHISLFNPITVPSPNMVIKDGFNRAVLMTWNNMSPHNLRELQFIIRSGAQVLETITEPETVTPENPMVMNATKTLGVILNVTGVSSGISIVISEVAALEDMAPPPSMWKVVGKCIQISVSDKSAEANATIRMYYTDADVVGLEESALRIHYWNGTAWVAEEPCYVNAEENYVEANITHFSDWVLLGKLSPPRITLTPNRDIGFSIVTISGEVFEPNSWVGIDLGGARVVSFETDADGNFTGSFVIPIAKAGVYNVTAIDESGRIAWASFIVVDVTPLDVEADVGSIHFRGEIAEFYGLITFRGIPVNITDGKAILYKPDGTSEDLTSLIVQVATGFYRLKYSIPLNAPKGTYTLLVIARYSNDTVDSRGASFKSFLLSPTLTLWHETYIPTLERIEGNIGTILTEIGYVQVNLTAINATIVNTKGKVAEMVTEIGYVEAKLDVIKPLVEGMNATLITIQGNMSLIKTYLGTVSMDVSAINAKITSVNGSLVTIESDVGKIKTDVSNINAKLAYIDGNIAMITTSLGTINGTITSVQGDIATIKTDIGLIETKLAGWAGTVSAVTTPTGTFNLLALTNSTLEETTFSDNTLRLTVSGPSGTKGITNVAIPKALLDTIGSTINRVAVTVNDQVVIFAYTERADSYTLHITYTHSVEVIEIYLKGLPPTPFPWHYLVLAIAAGMIATGAAIYAMRIRKKH